MTYEPAKPKCPLCDDSGEVVVRPTRLIGATYLDGDSGDERIERCPFSPEHAIEYWFKRHADTTPRELIAPPEEYGGEK